MNSIILAILKALTAFARGFFRTIIKFGRLCLEWVEGVVQIIPEALGSLIPRRGGGVAPSNSTESTPINAQRAERQAVLNASDESTRKRALAVTVRVCARVVLRGQEPVGLTQPHALWLKSLPENVLEYLAKLDNADLTRCLDNDRTLPPAVRYCAETWETVAPITLGRTATIADIKRARTARAQDRLRRSLNPATRPSLNVVQK